MNYFGNELRLGLVKNINEDTSLLNLVIPEVILKFLLEYQSEININMDILTQFESEEIRYFYNEEVDDLLNFAISALKSLENKNVNQSFEAYRDKLNLTENNISKDDVREVFQHLNHICNIALNGEKILFVFVGFDDTALIEG